MNSTINNSKFLSIGSVVLLKEGKQKLMIIGFYSTDPKEESKLYDYVGVFYPQGLLSLDKSFAFNHSDIKEVFFNGYNNDEDKIYKSYLKKFENEYTSNGYLKPESIKLIEKMSKGEINNG